MRLNFFKYHVQDRDYTTSEVMSLINNDAYKHHILSADEHFYSTGATMETLKIPLVMIGAAAAVIGIAVIASGNNSSNESGSVSNYDGGLSYGNSGNTYNNYVFNTPTYNTINNYNALPYNTTQIVDYGTFTGREVAKFLNEYYNYHLYKFNGNAHYSNIINNFLNHKYIDAEVPTLGDSGWFEIAVLDSYE